MHLKAVEEVDWKASYRGFLFVLERLKVKLPMEGKI